MISVLVLAILGAATAPAAESTVSGANVTAKPGAPVTYTTKEGDTCDSVSSRFFGSVPGAIAHLHDLNPTMGPPPHYKLKPGTVLSINPSPQAGPKTPDSDAVLTFLVPHVERRPAQVPSWAEASINELLFRLDQVSTRKGAGAELTFRDTSRLQLKENALIVVLGGEKLPSGERKSSGFELMQGELKLAMAELRKTPMPVTLPGATVSAQSRDALVSVDPENTSRLCLYDGTASVTAQGTTVKIKKNEGTRVQKGKAPEKPRPLPATPAWKSEEPIVIVTADAEVPVTLDFTAENTVKTRLEVAADDKFNAVGVDDTKDTLTRTASLKPGRYFARLSSVDALGLQSAASKSLRIDVIAMRGSAEGKNVVPAGIEVDLPEDCELLDGDAVVKLPLVLKTLGKHTLKLRRVADQKILSSIEVEAVLPPPKVTAQPTDAGARVSALFPADIEGLPLRWVEAQTGSAYPRVSGSTGEFNADIAAAAGTSGTAELQYDSKGIASVGWTSGTPAPVAAEPPPEPVKEHVCATPYLRNDATVGNAQWAYLDTEKCIDAELALVMGASASSEFRASTGIRASIPMPFLEALRVQANARTSLTGIVVNTLEANLGVHYRIDVNDQLHLGVGADFGVIGIPAVRVRGLLTAAYRLEWAEFSAGYGLAHQTTLANLRNAGFFEVAVPIGKYFHLQGQANLDVPWLHMNRAQADLSLGVSFQWNWLRISAAGVVPVGWQRDLERYRYPGAQLTFGYLN